jgi:hypothetical protein
MIDLKDILEMWQEDCVIPRNSLDETSRQTPSLHAKYLKMLSEAKLQMKRAERQQKILLKEKWLYYNGKMDQDQLEEKGWNPDPFDGLKVLKGEMDYYYNSDPEIQLSEEKIQYWKTVIETLIDIIDNIKWRHQTIGNMIRWRQFEAGG